LTRQAADGVGVFGQVRVACRKVGQPSSAFLERRRRHQYEPRCLPGAFAEELLVIADETGQPTAPAQRFAAAKLECDDGDARATEVLFEWWKTHIARLRMDRVALPAEVAETRVKTAIPGREQRLQMAAVLGRLDIRTADKGDDIAWFHNETRVGKRLALRRVRVGGTRPFLKRTGKIGARHGNQRREQAGEHAAELDEPCAPGS